MKNFTTKIMALGMTLAFLTCGLTACRNTSAAEPEKAPEVPAASEQEEQAPVNNGQAVGGWQIPASLEVTAEAKKAFDEAIGKLDGFGYEPVELLATQVVAGTNYCLLCRSTVTAHSGPLDYAIVYINVNPAGEANYLRSDVLTLGGAQAAENSVGSWTRTESYAITPELNEVLSKATATLTGASYNAIACLGTQVVSGRNYAFVCQVTPTVPDAKTAYALVYVYEDTSGNCKISNTIDIGFLATGESGSIG